MANAVVVARIAKETELKSFNDKKTGAPTALLALTLVEDTQDGPKWYDAVAFGGFAENLNAVLKKGMEIKACGQIKEKEFTKKDGSVGSSKSITLAKVVLEGGKELDKFSKAPEKTPAPF